MDEEETRSKMMKAFSNVSLRQILVSCFDSPKAASTLAVDLDIPLSTAYNYVHELMEAGLLAVERSVITDDGKRYAMYRSVAREIRFLVSSNGTTVEIFPNEEVTTRFYRLWSSLKKVK